MIASQVLYDAFRDMCCEDFQSIMERDYPDFNEALMVFLPKKAAGTTVDGMEYFTASCTRPLSITNVDNRLICSAVRIFIEP